MLTRAVWEKSNGTVGKVIGLDCAAANDRAYDKLRATLSPPPRQDQVRFMAADFSNGLSDFADASIHGIVSGLAFSYAESYSEPLGRWTTAAYDRLLKETFRILVPGGKLVFSVNVPEPAWGMVAIDALKGALGTRRPHRYLLKAWRIWRYGGWLKREARRGRFHYLPLETIRTKLLEAGFRDINAEVSYSGQAYVISCRKPSAADRKAA
jgi:SAM-dependent methyltransferase